MNFLYQKISNQLLKIKKTFKSFQLKLFLKKFNSVGQNCYVEQPIRMEGTKYITLANNVSINAFVHIWGHGTVKIGNDCLIASHVAIISVTHSTDALVFRESIIKKTCYQW